MAQANVVSPDAVRVPVNVARFVVPGRVFDCLSRRDSVKEGAVPVRRLKSSVTLSSFQPPPAGPVVNSWAKVLVLMVSPEAALFSARLLTLTPVVNAAAVASALAVVHVLSL